MRSGKDQEKVTNPTWHADYDKIIDFVEERMNDPNRAPYSWNPFKPNTCATFARDAFRAGLK